MKFRSFTIIFMLLLFMAVATYALFELMIKATVWLALLFVIIITGGLLLVLINPFNKEFYTALNAKRPARA